MRHSVMTAQLMRQWRSAGDAEASERSARQAEALAGRDPDTSRLVAIARTLAGSVRGLVVRPT